MLCLLDMLLVRKKDINYVRLPTDSLLLRRNTALRKVIELIQTKNFSYRSKVQPVVITVKCDGDLKGLLLKICIITASEG